MSHLIVFRIILSTLQIQNFDVSYLFINICSSFSIQFNCSWPRDLYSLKYSLSDCVFVFSRKISKLFCKNRTVGGLIHVCVGWQLSIVNQESRTENRKKWRGAHWMVSTSARARAIALLSWYWASNNAS